MGQLNPLLKSFKPVLTSTEPQHTRSSQRGPPESRVLWGSRYEPAPGGTQAAPLLAAGVSCAYRLGCACHLSARAAKSACRRPALPRPGLPPAGRAAPRAWGGSCHLTPPRPCTALVTQAGGTGLARGCLHAAGLVLSRPGPVRGAQPRAARALGWKHGCRQRVAWDPSVCFDVH